MMCVLSSTQKGQMCDSSDFAAASWLGFGHKKYPSRTRFRRRKVATRRSQVADLGFAGTLYCERCCRCPTVENYYNIKSILSD